MYIYSALLSQAGWGRVPVANVLDCNIVVSKFKLLLCYYVHFQTNTLGKGMNSLISPRLWIE